MKSLVHSHTIRQILFWLLLWTSVFLFMLGFELSAQTGMRLSVLCAGMVFVVGLNVEWLMPVFFFQKKYAVYAGISLAILITWARIVPALLLHNVLDFEQGRGLYGGHFGGPPFVRGYFFLIPLLISLIGSALYEISRYAGRKEQEAALLRGEKLDTELKFLKSQINPHFLFNALNNVYTQVVLKSDAAPENLLKLSAMLRYVLYDCGATRVPLRKELEYIRNYIDLMRLKDSEGVQVRISLDESHPELYVAPLLFVPFIENAFKHCDVSRDGWVDIKLEIKRQTLLFQVKNNLPAQPVAKDKVGGIGLDNVRRQLDLIYPGQYELSVNKDDSVFEMSLKINIIENK